MNSAKRFIISYIVTSLIYLGCDFVWLGATSARLYQPVLAEHLAAKYDWLAVALFYPLYFMGLTVFVVQPAKLTEKYLFTALRGVLFGVVAYATYDLTNQATLTGWPWFLSIVDIAWGGFATALTSVITRAVLNREIFLPRKSSR